jgi:hypothetical protein
LNGCPGARHGGEVAVAHRFHVKGAGVLATIFPRAPSAEVQTTRGRAARRFRQKCNCCPPSWNG